MADAQELDALKAAHRTTWAAGDLAGVSDLFLPISERLVDEAEVRSGLQVLEVGTGTGTVAVLAAQKDAKVVGLDLAPELFESARRRAGAAGVEVAWVEGDVEDLRFEDGHFERVLSGFGVQFAPRHEVAAREMVRVCKPAGLIGLANWTPEGVFGQTMKTTGRYLPPPPEFASPPPLWGSESHVEELFAGTGVELELRRETFTFGFESVEDWIQFLETTYGPTMAARQRLEPEGTWQDLRRALVALWESFNEASDGMRVNAEYLLVLGRKRG